MKTTRDVGNTSLFLTSWKGRVSCLCLKSAPQPPLLCLFLLFLETPMSVCSSSVNTFALHQDFYLSWPLDLDFSQLYPYADVF